MPGNLRNQYALHKIILNVVKTLMMNELEIVYLSLYLDYLGWVSEGFQLDENMLMLGVAVKVTIIKKLIKFENKKKLISSF